MSSDVELIVNAIEGLHTNIIKDYILPVGSVLVSGALGAGVAYYSVDRQEKTRIEISKIQNLNNTLLIAMDVRMSLISIKQNHFGLICDEPIKRMLTVPPIILSEREANIDFSSLSFIAPSTGDGSFNKWSSIEYISTIFSNYNSLLSLWSKRNEMITSLTPKLKPYFGQPLSYQMLQQLIGDGLISQLSDLTERALHMTDDLLIEVSAFLVGFSEVAKTKVEKRVVKKFGNILSVTLPNSKDFPKAVEIVTKVPEVNYKLLSQLHGRPEPELRERYREIY
ncbi:hypothetical protein [Photobacterium leiognathi]|uniref:hypothetical protein n=1 Tax=Photobacterium leiognathi TaxID=553611 RepID=UPI002980A975|nr:hypothetical protein [Photobacterium leiognathi]